jgi:dipeptidyl aminopeptidase/acylaminoacyl peptidase
VIDSLHYRVDGIGYRPQRQQIVIFDLETQLWAEVTGTGHLADEATWSPDGRLIGYTADRRDGWRDRHDRADLWVRDLTTGEERVLTTGAGPVISPAFSPDGRWIAYLGHEHGSEVDRHLRLYVVPSDGSAPARRLTPTLDRSVCAQMPTGKQFIWLDDSDSVLFLVAERGTVGIARCSMRAATVTDSLVADDRQVDGLDASGDGGLVAFTSQWPDAPSEAHWRIGGHVKAATSYNGAQPWLGSLVPLQRIEWEGSDGAPLEGFAAYPRDRQAGRRYSLVLVVHGGPHGFHPYPAGVWLTQSLAAAGFVVLLPNPRGSGGYDEEFKRQVTQNWGTANFRDVMPLVDVAVADGTADPDRMYLCGTSYGGYLTAFITTRTTRFRAAAMGAGMVNLLSTLGTSDITDYFLHEIGSEPYADPDSFMSRSPLAAAANVSTPTLIIHWDGDLRCPVSQSEEWFTALKLHNVRVRFVRYPGGSHTSSTPSQLVDRIERLVGWFSDPFR